MPEEIALFIDFENIRYSMLNIQRREPDPQELIAVARRYGTVMVARAYADWSRQPEPFKGSLTAAMIDRVDCPAKQRDRIRMGTVHYTGNQPSGALSAPMFVPDQGTGSLAPTPFQRDWPGDSLGNSGPLPAIPSQEMRNDWGAYQDTSEIDQTELDEDFLAEDGPVTDESYQLPDYQQRDLSRPNAPYQTPYGQSAPTGPLSSSSNTGPLGFNSSNPVQSTGNTGQMPAINMSGSSTIVQSTVVQSTVDLNMLMDIIETVFDRPTISTFVLMTGDKDFTRISARLKLRLNKTVIVVGIPGTVSRDLISSANQFVPLVPGGPPVAIGIGDSGFGSMLLVIQEACLLSLWDHLLGSSRHIQWMLLTHSYSNFWIILIATGRGAQLSACQTSSEILSTLKIAFEVASLVNLLANCSIVVFNRVFFSCKQIQPGRKTSG